MIEITSATRPHGNEMCLCCMSREDTKRLKFSLDGTMGTSLVLCKKCREELMWKITYIDSPDFSVGDEVYILDKTDREVITDIQGDLAVIMSCRGRFEVCKTKFLHKTGRKFPIENILKNLNGVLE